MPQTGHIIGIIPDDDITDCATIFPGSPSPGNGFLTRSQRNQGNFVTGLNFLSVRQGVKNGGTCKKIRAGRSLPVIDPPEVSIFPVLAGMLRYQDQIDLHARDDVDR